MTSMKTKPNISFDNLEVAFASKTDAQLKKMYFIFAAMNNNTLVKYGVKLANLAFQLRLPINGIMKSTMFGHFCGGENIEDCHSSVKTLSKFNIKSILDYSVEGEGDEKSFDATRDEILLTIKKAANSKDMPFAVFKITGIGDFEILTKLQSGVALTEKEQKAYEKLCERFDALCKSAHDHQVKILVDAEESWFQDQIDSLTYLAMEKYNQEKCIVYNTYQMYRHDMLSRLKAAHQTASEKGYILGAKLVRGAYMEKERDRAAKNGYLSPIQPDKSSTDRDYNQGLTYCIENIHNICLVSGSHNEKSNLLLTELLSKIDVESIDDRVYFAQLYGMSDNISYNLAEAGYNVVKYVPYGPVEKVMPYLGRRAEENTSVAGQSSREFDLIKREISRRKN
jgi:proline dehydrogenase